MVPHRWVLFKAFHKNVEGLAGFWETIIHDQHCVHDQHSIHD